VKRRRLWVIERKDKRAGWEVFDTNCVYLRRNADARERFERVRSAYDAEFRWAIYFPSDPAGDPS
jgi:hypothetical protein